MAYMSRSAERRADVRNVVAGARSVIVTGTIYNTSEVRLKDSTGSSEAIIARYALGDDYHDVLKKRLDALLAWASSSGSIGIRYRAYVPAYRRRLIPGGLAGITTPD